MRMCAQPRITTGVSGNHKQLLLWHKPIGAGFAIHQILISAAVGFLAEPSLVVRFTMQSHSLGSIENYRLNTTSESTLLIDFMWYCFVKPIEWHLPIRFCLSLATVRQTQVGGHYSAALHCFCSWRNRDLAEFESEPNQLEGLAQLGGA